MTIAESVRLSILELYSQGRSIREIVTDTGVSKSTVERIIRSAKEVPKNEDTVVKNGTHAHAHASVAVSSKKKTVSSKNEDTPESVVTVMEVRTITRDLTISELFDLLQSAKEDLEIARRYNDGSKDAVMAVSSSTKVVTEILKQMGKWCGLDDTLTGESKRDTVGRADVENMSLEDMRELVRDL